MADQPTYNLEPVGDDDLNTESKFKLPAENKEELAKPVESEKKVESYKEVSGAEREKAYQNIFQRIKPTGTSQPQDEEIKEDAKGVFEKEDREGKIKTLVDLATTKGVYHAVKVAKHLEDNYVLDEFHDRLLADELHEALVGKGLLKEV